MSMIMCTVHQQCLLTEAIVATNGHFFPTPRTKSSRHWCVLSNTNFKVCLTIPVRNPRSIALDAVIATKIQPKTYNSKRVILTICQIVTH